MVMSTLHTNDAPQTLTRLTNMGVAPFAVASAVSLIIAQRLGRRLCDSCKAPDKVPAEALLKEGFSAEEIPSLQIFKPVGCDKCNKGYKGRTGIYQVMPISEEIGRIIMEGGNALNIADQAEKDGVMDLRGAALMKVRAGTLGLEEANRISKD
jgi:type IV pilus assembly protein PilB